MATAEIKAAQHSPWMVLLTVMVGTLLIGLDRTVVNLGLPQMISDFGITVSTAGWIATAYIISNAVFVPVFGKLGDMFGNRLIYLWSFVGFILASIAAGAAWSIGSMIVFRALQGLVGAAVYPTAMSLIAKTFENKQERAQALGIWSASFAVSAVIGPLVGGPLIDNLSWRWLFYINLPVGLIGLLMVLAFLPKDRPGGVEPFDYKGAVLLGIALSSLVLVLERGSDWGWLSLQSIAAYFVMLVFGAWFYAVEKRFKYPIVDLKFFTNSVFVSTLAVSFVSFGGMMGAMFLLPVFAQNFLGYDATQTGYLFIPMAFTMLAVAPLGSRIAAKVQPRFLVGIGMAIAAFGIFLLTGLDPKTTAVDLIVPLMLLATGLGLGMAPLTAAATNSVPSHEVGSASAILNLIRNIAGAIAIAIFGTLLTSITEGKVLAIAAHTVVVDHTPATIQAATTLIIMKAQVTAYGDVFLVASIALFAGAGIALFLREPSSDFEDASGVKKKQRDISIV